MSIEQSNILLVRRYFDEVLNGGDLRVVDELFAPTYEASGGLVGAARVHSGADGMKQVIRTFHDAFPDARITGDEFIASGDKVVVRWTLRGTHQGELMSIPATGRQATITGISILRIVDGKFQDAWQEADFLGLVQQLGAGLSVEQARER
jgi:predicted ester cyclase